MGSQRPNVPPWDTGPWCNRSDVRDIRDDTPGRSYHPPRETTRHQERLPLHPTYTPIAFALQFCALRYPRHANAMMRELRVREAVLRTGTTSRRKSPTAPSLLDLGVRRTSAPPLYTQVDRWSCSVALQSPSHVAPMRAREGGPWGRGALCGKIGNRAFVVCSGCVQGVCRVVPHLPKPLVMLRYPQNSRSPFSPPPPRC
jgi:hypothetical protein